MEIKVDKTYSTDKITLRYTSGLGWELVVGKDRIYFSNETFEELKAIMTEVLYGIAENR
jgi:hypothetical protein